MRIWTGLLCQLIKGLLTLLSSMDCTAPVVFRTHALLVRPVSHGPELREAVVLCPATADTTHHHRPATHQPAGEAGGDVGDERGVGANRPEPEAEGPGAQAIDLIGQGL